MVRGLSLMLASPVRGWKKQDTYTDSVGTMPCLSGLSRMPFMQGVVSDVRQSCQADGPSRWGGPATGVGASRKRLFFEIIQISPPL